jgi:hypothetical protein
MASGTSSWLRRVIASLVVVVAVTAAVAACGGSTKPTSNSTSTARQSTKTATQTGGGPAPSATGGQTSGRPRDTPASGVRDLPCGEFIATQPPAHDMRVVLGGRRAADKPALAARAADRAVGPARSDSAAVCQVGTGNPRRCSLGVIVPDPLRDEFSIGWGNAGEGHRGTTIVVDACTGPEGAKWLAYAGGYYVRDPFCAPLLVAAHQQRRQVRIGVGKACPGQRPPPQPTQG